MEGREREIEGQRQERGGGRWEAEAASSEEE